jgi:carbamoyl-phosphate synthase large subunit
VSDSSDLQRYMREAVTVSNDAPVLLDRYLNDAIEVDVDAICDGTQVLIGGIMEHIEEAGIHSGDSACSIPPYTLSKTTQDSLRAQMRSMALELGVVGLMNAQFAIKGKDIYILEVNPRASRTVPFVSKAIGLPLAKIAARCMVGKTLAQQGIKGEIIPDYYSVKESVFPFTKFPGVDAILGPEMKSTGEVMGVGKSFGEAFYKRARGRQEGLCRDRARPDPQGIQDHRDRRHGRGAAQVGPVLRPRQQGDTGASAHRGYDKERRDRSHCEHDRRQAGDTGFVRDPA